MKLELGKQYRTRSGNIVKISGYDPDAKYPYAGSRKEDSGWYCWKPNGNYLESGNLSANDIVSEHREPRTFEREFHWEADSEALSFHLSGRGDTDISKFRGTRFKLSLVEILEEPKP